MSRGSLRKQVSRRPSREKGTASKRKKRKKTDIERNWSKKQVKTRPLLLLLQMVDDDDDDDGRWMMKGGRESKKSTKEEWRAKPPHRSSQSVAKKKRTTLGRKETKLCNLFYNLVVVSRVSAINFEERAISTYFIKWKCYWTEPVPECACACVHKGRMERS